MKRTALILIVMAALAAAATASPQVRWQHPSKTEWFHKATLSFEHRIDWTFTGTTSCLLPGSDQRVRVPVRGEGTAVLRGAPVPSWPSIWRLEKDGYQGYRGVYGAPGLYDVGGNWGPRGGIIVRLTREETGQMTTDFSACGRPVEVTKEDPFQYACRESPRQAMNLTYNQRIHYVRRIGRTVPDRRREHRHLMYLDDPELARGEDIDPWRRACLVETKDPFAPMPWRSRKSMTFSWGERKSGRIEKPLSGAYEWTSNTSVEFGLSFCRAKYSRGSWPEFKGCR